jgi:hypothetical protein
MREVKRESNMVPAKDLIPYCLPKMATPRRKRGTERMKMDRPVSSLMVWYRMMAIPLTPPLAIFAGEEKRAIPKAVRNDPVVM